MRELATCLGLGLALCTGLSAAEQPSPSKLTIEVHYTDINGLSCPCGGIAQSFLTPGVAAYGMARGLNSLKLMGDLGKFMADPSSIPKSTGDIARYSSRGIPFDLSGIPLTTRYSATLHATLAWNDGKSRWDVESGSLTYKASDTTHFGGGSAGAVTDNISASGSYTLRPGSDEVTIKSKPDDAPLDKTLADSGSSCKSPNATYTLKINLNHKMTASGTTSWSGESFHFDVKQTDTKRTFSGESLGKPIPSKTETLVVTQPWHYEQNLKLVGGTARIGDSWTDEGGGQASIRGTVTLQGEVLAKPKLSKSRPTRFDDLVTLDGSGSLPTEKITKWKWTFSEAKVPDEPLLGQTTTPSEDAANAALSGKTIEAKQAKARILAQVCVTLEVTADSGKTDKKSSPIEPKARHGEPWRTKVVASPSDYGDADWGEVTHSMKQVLLGRNTCFFDPDRKKEDKTATGSHWIHHLPDDSAYDVEQVTDDDENAPFHGWSYVASLKDSLTVKRIRLLNPGFHSGGSKSLTFFDHNSDGAYAVDRDLLIASVKLHEQLHSDLATEALTGKNFDPRHHLEYVMDPDDNQVKARAEDKIFACDCGLTAASTDANVHARMGNFAGKVVTVRALDRNGEWVDTTIGPLDTAGDESIDLGKVGCPQP